MEPQDVVKAMKVSKSVLFLLVPGQYTEFAQCVLLPSLVRPGTSEEGAEDTVHLEGSDGSR